MNKDKKINLYLVCYTKNNDSDTKKSIKNLCEEQNNNYCQNKDNILEIHLVGYNDPEKEDDVAKNFIENNANIVIFLFDKESDETQIKRMETLLEEAVNINKKQSRPEILVYLPDDEDIKVSEKTQTLLKNNSIIRCSDNVTEFSEIVKVNILAYFTSYEMLGHAKEIRKTWNKTKVVLWAIIIIIGTAIIWTYSYWSQKRILIAGGGSAMNMIKTLTIDKEVKDVPISNIYKIESIVKDIKRMIKGEVFRVYAPLPTSDAYHLLTEETEMEIKDTNYFNRDYYTVILSAGKAEDYKFLSCGNSGNVNDNSINDSIRLERIKTRSQSISDFRKTGVVMGIFMGWDSLTLYTKGCHISNRMEKAKFKEFIEKTDSNIIYTTNINSGTFKQYQEITDSTIKHSQKRIFYSSNIIGGNSWVALGSMYYGPRYDVKNDTTVRKTIITGAEPKPIYVYFMRYRNVKKNTYDLPEETENYLIDIGIPQNLIEKIKNDTRPATIDTAILFDDFSVDTTYKNSSHIE